MIYEVVEEFEFNDDLGIKKATDCLRDSRLNQDAIQYSDANHVVNISLSLRDIDTLQVTPLFFCFGRKIVFRRKWVLSFFGCHGFKLVKEPGSFMTSFSLAEILWFPDKSSIELRTYDGLSVFLSCPQLQGRVIKTGCIDRDNPETSITCSWSITNFTRSRRV